MYYRIRSFYKELINKSDVNMTKGQGKLKILYTTKKVKIFEINYIISISTLKHRIASDFEGLLWKFT